jgi:hypothetical protein
MSTSSSVLNPAASRHHRADLVGFVVLITGSYFLAMMFFAGAGMAFLICSIAIDYSRKLPV